MIHIFCLYQNNFYNKDNQTTMAILPFLRFENRINKSVGNVLLCEIHIEESPLLHINKYIGVFSFGVFRFSKLS